MLKRLTNNSFVKAVAVLTSGTLIAQLFAYLLTPIISRLYLPEEMAILALFTQIISIGAAIATARFEFAIPTLKLDVHAFRLYYFTRRFVLYISLVSALLILIVPILLLREDNFYFWSLIPIGIFILASNALGTNWALRKEKFSNISYSKITNSVGNNLLKVVFGFLKMSSLGLLLSLIISQISANWFFLKDYLQGRKEHQVRTSKRNVAVAKQQLDFPKYNLPHVLLDLSRDILVTLLIWNYFSQQDYGHYSYTYQMMRLPLILIGTSIGQVFFQRCTALYNEKKEIFSFALRNTLILGAIAILPFLVIQFFGTEIFSFIFGERWATSGEFAEIMTAWFFLNFIASPISTLPVVLKKQRLFLFIGLLGALVMVLSLAFSIFILQSSIHETLQLLTITQSVFFVFYIGSVLKICKRHDEKLNHQL